MSISVELAVVLTRPDLQKFLKEAILLRLVPHCDVGHYVLHNLAVDEKRGHGRLYQEASQGIQERIGTPPFIRYRFL
jgi:hypothetical protein